MHFLRRLAVGTALALCLVPAAALAAPGGGNANGHVAKVMTRNLYLGADLSPAIGTTSIPALVAADGVILRQVARDELPGSGQGARR